MRVSEYLAANQSKLSMRSTILLLTFLVTPLSSWAETPDTPDLKRWGWDAHKMVCAIAWWDMEESTQDKVIELLAVDGRYDRFLDSCLWADEVRGRDATYDRWTTAHYVNLPRGATDFDIERDCANTFCVVEGIIESRNLLAASDEVNRERLDALRFLGHIIGDIHQPLHAGYADDRGGNDTQIMLFGNETNLHSAWDWGLIDHTGKRWIDYASELYFDISNSDRAEWTSEDPGSWSVESFEIVYASAYDLDDGIVGQDYYDRHIELIETRIQQAGVRLADWLDNLLGD
jgi:hypothetical protein